MIEKTCPVCNAKFYTEVKQRKYCSRECYKKRNRNVELERSRKITIERRLRMLDNVIIRCHDMGITVSENVINECKEKINTIKHRITMKEIMRLIYVISRRQCRDSIPFNKIQEVALSFGVKFKLKSKEISKLFSEEETNFCPTHNLLIHNIRMLPKKYPVYEELLPFAEKIAKHEDNELIGKSTLARAAAIWYLVVINHSARPEGLPLHTQEKISHFYGITDVTMRNILTIYKKNIKKELK